MSLDYDLSKVPDEVKRHPENPELLNPVTEALIWSTMATTIWELTEENYQRAYVRIATWERTFGSYVKAYAKDGRIVDRYITMEDVKAHIGLRTNAFPEISGNEFGAKLYGALRDRIYSQIRSEAGSFYAGQEIVWPIEEIESGRAAESSEL